MDPKAFEPRYTAEAGDETHKVIDLHQDSVFSEYPTLRNAQEMADQLNLTHFDTVHDGIMLKMRISDIFHTCGRSIMHQLVDRGWSASGSTPVVSVRLT